MESHSADLNLVTKAEEGLFATELQSIEQCEEHLSTASTSSSSVLPDWFDRPGATEAVEVRADLKNRYSKLGVEIGTRCGEGAGLLEKVLSYETKHDKLKEWLVTEKGRVEALGPLTITNGEIRQQLKETEVSQSQGVGDPACKDLHVPSICRTLGEISRTRRRVWSL